jgi:hypothetical protein
MNAGPESVHFGNPVWQQERSAPMRIRACIFSLGLGSLTLSMSPAAFAAAIISDGSDGPFNPTGSQQIKLNDVAPDGIFNFTSIHIPANVTITFERNTANTPVFFAATGDVLIEGTINVSGTDYSKTSGPGGGDGGLASPNSAGSAGQGLSPGQGGPPPAGQGNAGGGAGMGTDGKIATARTGSNPGSPGLKIPRPELLPGQTGTAGSGGGGGGGRTYFGVNISGGDGGGGGGGLQISTPGNLTLKGKLSANGGHGAWSFANAFARGGPGGGGAGGNIELYAQNIIIDGTPAIEARGGAGGGLSTEPVPRDPFTYSSHADGGKGYLYLGANLIYGEPTMQINVVVVMDRYAAPDYDHDGDVDLDDLTVFESCASGPGIPYGGDCGMCDFDADNDVDQTDFATVQCCFSGRNVLAVPGCAD